MKNLISILIVSILAFILSGCDDTSSVKNGIMDFDKTLTVGEAFDNWNACDSSNWKSFETDNGQRIVEFTCIKKDFKEYMNKTITLLSEKDQNNKDVSSALDVRSNKQVFQWTINKDDTFQIDNVQVETIWSDGTKFEDSQAPMEQLPNVYANENTFDLNELNQMTANQIAYAFMMIKAVAKRKN